MNSRSSSGLSLSLDSSKISFPSSSSDDESFSSPTPSLFTIFEQPILDRIYFWLIFPVHRQALSTLFHLLLTSRWVHGTVQEFLQTHVFLILTEKAHGKWQFATYPPSWRWQDPFAHFLRLLPTLAHVCILVDQHSHRMWHPFTSAWFSKYYVAYSSLPWTPATLTSTLPRVQRLRLSDLLSVHVPTLFAASATATATATVKDPALFPATWFLPLLYQPPRRLHTLHVLDPHTRLPGWLPPLLLRVRHDTLAHATLWGAHAVTVCGPRLRTLSLQGVQVHALLVPTLHALWCHQCEFPSETRLLQLLQHTPLQFFSFQHGAQPAFSFMYQCRFDPVHERHLIQVHHTDFLAKHKKRAVPGDQQKIRESVEEFIKLLHLSAGPECRIRVI